jgi:hypothetical protein
MAEPSEAAEELLDASRYGDYADASAALDSNTPVNSADELGRTGQLNDKYIVSAFDGRFPLFTLQPCINT